MFRWRPVVWPWHCDPKSSRDYLLRYVNQCDKFGNHQAMGHNILSTQFFGWRSAVWLWPWSHDLKINSLGTTTVPNLVTMKLFQKSFSIEQTTLYQQSDLHLWSCELNRGHLLSKNIHCTEFSKFPSEGSRDILIRRQHFFTGRRCCCSLKNNVLMYCYSVK